ncbi:hypothetical protein Sango_2465600 [Sesamum angolense]|uniref:DUF7615 domain-containing protein n=1 Tax=Sesamum angolense TaxID=2727404 RepID=A0AAE1W876_9LAMI|nr:hypothetical protein Sango_2465600 [Sesamum angolense]
MSKLKNGTDLEDIWKKEDVSAATAGLSSNSNGALGFAKNESQDQETDSPLSSKFDHQVESLKLEDEVDQILDSLRNSTKERSDLSRHTSSEDQDSLLDAVLSRVDQVKREVSRLKDIAEVAKGFGRVPKHILKEQFDLDIEH